MRVPSSKVTQAQDCGRPWYRGCDTVQRKRTMVYFRSDLLLEEKSTTLKDYSASDGPSSYPSANEIWEGLYICLRLFFVCFHIVCLFVFVQDNSRTETPITSKFSGIVGFVNGKKWLNFGGDRTFVCGKTLQFLNGYNSRTVSWITTKFSGFVGNANDKNRLDFGGDQTFRIAYGKTLKFLNCCISRTVIWITTKFSEFVGITNGKNRLVFGGDRTFCLTLARS